MDLHEEKAAACVPIVPIAGPLLVAPVPCMSCTFCFVRRWSLRHHRWPRCPRPSHNPPLLSHLLQFHLASPLIRKRLHQYHPEPPPAPQLPSPTSPSQPRAAQSLHRYPTMHHVILLQHQSLIHTHWLPVELDSRHSFHFLSVQASRNKFLYLSGYMMVCNTSTQY